MKIKKYKYSVSLVMTKRTEENLLIKLCAVITQAPSEADALNMAKSIIKKENHKEIEEGFEFIDHCIIKIK